MKPPEHRRLLDDPSCPNELRSDLRQAVETSPIAFDVERELGRLLASVAVGTAAASAAEVAAASTAPSAGGALTAAGATGAAANAASGGALLKVAWWGLATVGVSGVVAFGVATATVERKSEASAPAEAASMLPRAEPAAAAPRLDSTVARAAIDEPAPRAPVASSTSAPRVSLAQPASSADSRPNTLVEETRYLSELRALAATNPGAALALADDGARRFPRGVFGHEREAIAIQALVALGRSSQARARAGRFLRAYPKSPYAERLRRATGLAAP
jgi:hypothetical protein